MPPSPAPFDMSGTLSPLLARCVALLIAFAICGVRFAVAADPEQSAAEIEFFESRIRPVLVEKCYRCHSQQAVEMNQLKGSLLVDSRDGLLKGGDSGPAIDSDDPGGSLLLESLRYESYEMPPDGQLPESVIADFATWIERGAADPRTGTATLPISAIDWEAARSHWAYRPLAVPPERPDSRRGRSPASPIDAFVLERLDDAGLEPATGSGPHDAGASPVFRPDRPASDTGAD